MGTDAVAGRKFEVLLRTPKGEGADLSSVIERLRALERIYDAIYTAEIRPGAARVSIPKAIEPYTRVRLVGASRSQSLGLQIEEPGTPPPSYEGEYHGLPDRGARRFRESLGAVLERSVGDLVSLFPEKADRVRILKGYESLAPNKDEPNVVLRGVDGFADVSLTANDRAWFEDALPTLSPEPIETAGMLKAGALGVNSTFRLFDGARTIVIRPAEDQLGQLRDLFGRVVRISGKVHYTPQGTIKFMDNVRDIGEFTHRVSTARSADREFVFNRPLSFSSDSSLDARGFALHNDELDIHVFGNSLKEAFDSVGEHFDFLWEEYALADKDELHESALGLRAKLLEIVGEVKQIDG